MNRVPYGRGKMQTEEAKIGAPVRGSSLWRGAARQTLWLRGQGRVVCPAFFERWEFSPLSGTLTWSFKLYQRAQAAAFRLSMLVQGDGNTVLVKPAGGSIVVIGGSFVAPPSPTVHDVIISTPRATGVQTIDLAFNPLSAAGEVRGMLLEEMPRAALAADTNDYGADINSLLGGQPIYDSDSWRNMLDAAAGSSGSDYGWLLRALVGWTVPHTSGTSVITDYAKRVSGSTSWQDLWSLPVPILLRSTDGSASGLCAVHILAWGSGGEVRASTNAGSVTQVVSAAAPTWYTLPVTGDREDLAASDGLRAGVWDSLRIELRASSLGDDINVAAVFAFEEA